MTNEWVNGFNTRNTPALEGFVPIMECIWGTREEAVRHTATLIEENPAFSVRVESRLSQDGRVITCAYVPTMEFEKRCQKPCRRLTLACSF